MIEMCPGTLSTTTLIFLFTTTLVVEEPICPQWSSLILVQSMGWERISWSLMGSLSKSNCLLQITSHCTSLTFSPYPRCHKETTNKTKSKKANYNHCNHPQTIPCTRVWTIKSSCDWGYHQCTFWGKRLPLMHLIPQKLSQRSQTTTINH